MEKVTSKIIQEEDTFSIANFQLPIYNNGCNLLDHLKTGKKKP